MAFSLYVSSNNGTTTSLSNGQPFSFDSLEGMSSAPIVRFQQRGPVQQGVTDLGYRLGPRILELSVLFRANTDALLDTYRQQLIDAFKPLTDTPIYLYCQRDDSATRRLLVHTVDEIGIELTPELRPGHSHRATLKLRAAKPLWVDDNVVQSSITALDAATTQWWLAGGTISPSVVLDYGTFPAQGQTWAYPGATLHTPITIAFRLGSESPVTTKYAFQVSNGTQSFDFRTVFPADYAFGLDEIPGDIIAGTHNYFWRFTGGDPLTPNASNGYRGTALVRSSMAQYPYVGTAAVARWRSGTAGTSNFWTTSIPKYALYNQALDDSQRAALDQYMAGTPTSFGSVYFDAVNEGDAPAYPVIRIAGPLSNITITNSNTGDSFSFGTTAIGSGDIYTVDLRTGDKKVYDINGVDRLSQVTSPAGLAGFRLEPSPVVAGGTNTITVVGSATAASSRVTIEHYNQYTSY